MRNWLNNYFDMSKREFNGLLVLVALILAVLLTPVIYTWLRPFRPDPDKAQQALAELNKVLVEQKNKPQRRSEDFFEKKPAGERPGYTRTVKSVPQLFNFDPNTTDQQGWQKLGFSAKQAQVILNYLSKGGRFRKAEDLQRLYVVSPATYQQLRPYVRIKATAANIGGNTAFQPVPNRAPASNTHQPAAAVMVEVNRADTTELIKIKGIGPAFARRIVKYRDRLGGFYRKEQLMEVFGLDSLKFNEIKDQISVDLSALKTLNINNAKFEDLKNHPYLRYKQINAIIQYREQHGNYGNFADLNKVAILTPEMLERMSPYLIYAP